MSAVGEGRLFCCRSLCSLTFHGSFSRKGLGRRGYSDTNSNCHHRDIQQRDMLASVVF
ncbi:unnamed protein product [Ixodes persulcatus]